MMKNGVGYEKTKGKKRRNINDAKKHLHGAWCDVPALSTHQMAGAGIHRMQGRKPLFWLTDSCGNDCGSDERKCEKVYMDDSGTVGWKQSAAVDRLCIADGH